MISESDVPSTLFLQKSVLQRTGHCNTRPTPRFQDIIIQTNVEASASLKQVLGAITSCY